MNKIYKPGYLCEARVISFHLASSVNWKVSLNQLIELLQNLSLSPELFMISFSSIFLTKQT